MRKSKELSLNFTQKPFCILSIDGGGVRGLMPLRILREIEERTGRPISHLFDVIVGNSTGGIIALGLAAQGEGNQPKYTPKDISHFYLTSLPQIFKKSFFRSLYTGLGLWAPKYDRLKLDNFLHGFFSGERLSHVVCPVFITSYNLTKDALSIWTSYRAKKDPNSDILIKDIASATSAAPTYFSPKKLVWPSGDVSYEVDGGIYANDPEEIAVQEALLNNPDLKPEQIFILSLGTGQPKLKKRAGQHLRNTGLLGWLLEVNLIDLMLNADTQLEEFQTESTDLFQRYRLQFNLNLKNKAMDNVQEENLAALLQVAENFVQKFEKEITHICDLLAQSPTLFTK